MAEEIHDAVVKNLKEAGYQESCGHEETYYTKK
jgi:hypothetical protein